MIFVDTGYWIALLDDRDELHARAARWAAAVHEPLVTTQLVLVETVNHLTHRLDRERLHTFLDALMQTPTLEVLPAMDALIHEGLQMHRLRADKAWSLTDCVSFSVMAQRGMRQALAYDHHFEQAGFVALLRADP